VSAEIALPAAAAPAQARVNRWLVLVLVLAAQFMVTLDAMVVNVALPSIQSALHFGSASSLQWVVNAYTLLFRRERGRALGLFGAVMAAGGATGLLLGGVLTSELSWRWIFYVNLPIGLLAVLAALYYVPNTRGAERPKSADVAGAAAVTTGLVLLVYAIVNAQQWRWASGTTLGLLAAAAALLAAFVLIELRSREPLVRLGIFAQRTLSAASGTAFLFMPGLFVTMFFPSLYLQEVLGYSPIKTGAAFLPFPLTMTVFAIGGQRLIRRTGARPPLIAGLLLGAASLLLLFGRIPVHGSYPRDVLPALVVMAVGTGLALPTIILVATSNVDSNEAGLASGIVNSSQQIGGALGLAVLATIAATKTASALPMAGGATTTATAGARAMVDGFQLGFTVAGAFLLAAALLTGLFIHRTDVEHLKAEPEPEPAAIAPALGAMPHKGTKKGPPGSPGLLRPQGNADQAPAPGRGPCRASRRRARYSGDGRLAPPAHGVCLSSRCWSRSPACGGAVGWSGISRWVWKKSCRAGFCSPRWRRSSGTRARARCGPRPSVWRASRVWIT
jgi:MFS family permease